MPIYTASAITAPIWVGDKIDALLRGVERSKEATLSELEYGQAKHRGGLGLEKREKNGKQMLPRKQPPRGT